jgi:hypothetical protein
MFELQSKKGFMVAWQLRNIMSSKKDDYYINNVLSNKGEINIPFGPIVFSK